MRTPAGATGTTLSVTMGMSSTAAVAAPFSPALKKPVLGLGFMLLVILDIFFTLVAVRDAPPVPSSECAPSTSWRSAAAHTPAVTRGLPWPGQEGKYSLGEPLREENLFPRELQPLHVLARLQYCPVSLTIGCSTTLVVIGSTKWPFPVLPAVTSAPRDSRCAAISVFLVFYYSENKHRSTNPVSAAALDLCSRVCISEDKV